MPQDEDCLSLTVWAPEGASGLPVLVFLHGGGFSSGSGGLAWYDGARLAERGRMVVVTVNYRLGALGFAYLAELADDAGAGNFGLLDQLAALRWVRDHIAGFGGDPDQVTAAGQSAGACSIVALLSGGSVRGLFRRAILQSLPGGVLPQRPAEATRISLLLLESLGLTDAARLRDVPVPDVLAAQQDVARRANLGVAPPFQLVADGDLVAGDPLRTVGERGADGVRIMLTFTRHEGRAFDPHSDALTEQYFVGPGRELAEALARQGNPPEWYEFAWSPPGSPFGACHCIELPFVFGTLDAWRHAPMLAGADPDELAGLVDDVQSRWISFVRS
jgi:para-nitrobenzyl esterase